MKTTQQDRLRMGYFAERTSTKETYATEVRVLDILNLLDDFANLEAQLAEARELLETASPDDNQVFIAYDGWFARRDAWFAKTTPAGIGGLVPPLVPGKAGR